MRIYVDGTVLITAIIGTSSEKQEARHAVERLLQHETVIPEIIMGEVITKVLQKSDSQHVQNNMSRLIDLIQKLLPEKKHLQGNTPETTKEVLETALKIRNDSTRMDYHDALLAAHAICDNEAEALFTFDNEIHDSQVIENLICKRRENGCPLRLLDDI